MSSKKQLLQEDHSSSSSTFQMPAEWEYHKGCIILYPHNVETFRLQQVQEQIHYLIHSIVHYGNEMVYIFCNTEHDAQTLRQQLQVPILLQQQPTDNDDNNHKDDTTGNAKEDEIQIHLCPSDDTWARDTGPTFCWETSGSTGVRNLVGLNWQFNAYGGPQDGCYWPCTLDQQIATNMCQILQINCINVPIVLEGGSIHADGNGTLLTTKECLLHKNRNPTLTQQDIESTLKRYLGITTMIWLPYGLHADEDTNGHVDNFCCFVQPGHVVLAWTDDNENDNENYNRCRQAESVLLQSKDANGRSITIHKLYLPPPLVSFPRISFGLFCVPVLHLFIWSPRGAKISRLWGARKAVTSRLPKNSHQKQFNVFFRVSNLFFRFRLLAFLPCLNVRPQKNSKLYPSSIRRRKLIL